MNFPLDILFLQKKMLGKNYRINIKPKYGKILKRPIIFYLIISYLTENELFELFYTCSKFNKLISDDPIFENKVLKFKIKIMKEKDKNKLIIDDNNRNIDVNAIIYNDYLDYFNKKFKLSYLNSKLKNEKLSKMKILDEIINNSNNMLSISYSNKNKSFELNKLKKKVEKNDDNFIDIEELEMKRKDMIDEIYFKLIEKELRYNNQYLDNNVFDIEKLNKYNYNYSPSNEKKFLDINKVNYSFEENNKKLNELNQQIQYYINEIERKNTKYNFEILSNKIKLISSSLFQNLHDIKEITFNNDEYVFKNFDIKKYKSK